MFRFVRAIALLFALVPALAGCGPSAPALTSIDLEPLLIQNGDLPPGIIGAQVRNDPPAMFDGIPAPAKTIYQQFAQDGVQRGGVGVFLYEKPDEVVDGYAFVKDGLGENATSADVGEQGAVLTGLLDMTDLAFMRCAAVVHIRLVGDIATATAYAQRLDTRLQTVVCPK